MAEETGKFGMWEKEVALGSAVTLGQGADKSLLDMSASDFAIADPPVLGQLQPTHLLVKKYEMSSYFEIETGEADTDVVTQELWLTMRKLEDRTTDIDVATLLAEQITDQVEHGRLLRKLGFMQTDNIPREISSGSFSKYHRAGFMMRKGTFKKAIPVDLKESAGISIRARNPSLDANQGVVIGQRTWLRIWGTLWDSDAARKQKSRSRR